MGYWPCMAESVRPFPFFRAGVRADPSSAVRPVLVLEGVCKYYRADVPTLKSVDLTVERGEFLFITGPSGAGKSTLLSLIYRKETVDEGRILFCGKDVGASLYCRPSTPNESQMRRTWTWSIPRRGKPKGTGHSTA